eukprot:GHRR01015518.1.p1 GENE.GHRR01015518.1~~GHRR01015518.1.p1  ORF type:complete len:164 (+),score=36.01 GHRR01015518.1:761-1252(+)
MCGSLLLMSRTDVKPCWWYCHWCQHGSLLACVHRIAFATGQCYHRTSTASLLAGVTAGYGDEVIFADGTFVDGSTAELSADGPIRPPYVVYCQGGTHWTHWALALEFALQSLQDHGITPPPTAATTVSAADGGAVTASVGLKTAAVHKAIETEIAVAAAVAVG